MIKKMKSKYEIVSNCLKILNSRNDCDRWYYEKIAHILSEYDPNSSTTYKDFDSQIELKFFCNGGASWALNDLL